MSSEVLDHTSVIRFLEQRFGVTEPNISAWRRAVCGDFLNAFDFKTPNHTSLPVFPNPGNDAQMAGELPERTVPTIPTDMSMPTQEKGRRPQRENLYNINVEFAAQDDSLKITFINTGSRATVFHVSDR